MKKKNIESKKRYERVHVGTRRHIMHTIHVSFPKQKFYPALNAAPSGGNTLSLLQRHTQLRWRIKKREFSFL